MNDFLTFRRMVVPIAVQVLWWLGNLGMVAIFFAGLSTLSDEIGGWSFPVMIVAVVLAFLWWRFVCELVLVIFRINETLSEIRRELRKEE